MYHPIHQMTNIEERAPIFDLTHRGIRHALSRLMQTASETDYKTYGSVAKLYRLGKQVFRLIAIHAQDEEEFIREHLALVLEQASVFKDYHYDEREERQELQHLLEQQMEVIHLLAGEMKDVTELGSQFRQGLKKLNMLHESCLSKVERKIQPVIWERLTDAEIHEAQRARIRKNKFDDLLILFRFTLPVLSAKERVHLFKDLRPVMPQLFFQSMLRELEGIVEKAELKQLETVLSN